VTQESHVMIEEEAPQLDPEELKRNVKIWKQQEAEALLHPCNTILDSGLQTTGPSPSHPLLSFYGLQ
jgi:hypothetical protein